MISKEEGALLDELEAAGISTQDFGWFGGRPEADRIEPVQFDYESAVPILLDWLPRTDDPTLKETIVRSLTGAKGARPAALKPLVHEFREASTDEEYGLKWAIGNALAVLADASIVDDLIELARDKRHGGSREMLMDALLRTKDERAFNLLVDLTDDDVVAGHAILALRRIGPKRSLPYLERARPSLDRQMVEGTPFAQRQAKAALTRLN